MHNQNKVVAAAASSGVFPGGVSSVAADRTPRQMMLEEKLRQREQGMRSRERMNSFQQLQL